MPGVQVEQLRAAAQRLEAAAERLTEVGSAALDALETAASDVARAWSGSSLGYHATVYYADLSVPPPGEHFSSEWGLMGSFAPGTSGDWREFDFDDVKTVIRAKAGDPDVDAITTTGVDVAESFRNEQSRFESLTSSATSGLSDPYIDGLREEARSLRLLSVSDGVRAQLPGGQLMSRDAVAVSAGLKYAPHQEILAEVVAARAPFAQSKELARLCRLAADHLELTPSEAQSRIVAVGTKVFIGHGRSPEWRKLKDFLQDRLLLEWDEFNRVPVAGVTNIARLQAMMDAASIAFLVMTAEDEQVDGEMRARENVVHEAGLFQGRLGFERAIVMVEDTCEPFSNIDGLGQLRFPQGRIEAVFEDVRAVLEREGLVSPSAGTD